MDSFMSFEGDIKDRLIYFLLDCIVLAYDEGRINNFQAKFLYRYVSYLVVSRSTLLTVEEFDSCFLSYYSYFYDDVSIGYVEPYADFHYTVAPSPSGNEDNINKS